MMRFFVGALIGIPAGALLFFLVPVFIGIILNNNLAGLVGVMIAPVGAIVGAIVGGIYWLNRNPSNRPGDEQKPTDKA